MANSKVKTNRGSKTTVALKVLMAATGIIFVLFLLFHMYGNLKMFLGADAYNHYAHYLHYELLYPILPRKGFVWIMRITLLLCIVLHMYSAITLWKRAVKARGNAYKVSSGKKVRASQSYTAFVMRWGGVLIAIWLVFHLLQFTALKLQVGGAYDVANPYNNMVLAFSIPWLYIFYLIAMLAIGFHIRHGVWSALATLGLSSRSRERMYKLVGSLVAGLIVVGFMLPPTFILFGFIS
ncbi:succinate dehydrogenase cytochrome b subunit [Arcanobacterium hippocoleae]|uniref:Succinate dehydrogenase / fumarate reductase cytochrome b subunit n=1 Tax=Arcanobacterium hippocoleae TaxID=149017 RepID=A0ABU1T453_9ACTO|nr:succinate dehydrogenase cytochrome b subunit [Arcanobacterium hippocoleae]MDR6940093.1 succinate dehydrogenase / fumarate reductase cytochrome b subunit [Arcanobacterium hippocoleae]